jgi:hypothetical protein
MATKKTKVKIKVSGTPAGVQKALSKLAGSDSFPLREGDYRQRNKSVKQ